MRRHRGICDILIIYYIINNAFVKSVYGGKKELWQEMNWVYNNEEYFQNSVNYKTSGSGLKYAILASEEKKISRRHGARKRIETGDHVAVYYKLYLLEKAGVGQHIYSQANKNIALKFEVGVTGTINHRGFEEAVRLMTLREKGRFILPPSIAYGTKGNNLLNIPPNSFLLYYIEVIEHVKRKEIGRNSIYRPSTEHLYREQSL